MKRFSRTLIFTGMLAAGALSQAQTFEQSLSASDRGDDRAAFAGFKRLGEQGHSKAQFNVGLMYRSGRGVAADDQQAAAWYRKAAEQGDVDASTTWQKFTATNTAHSRTSRLLISGYFWRALKAIKMLQETVIL